MPDRLITSEAEKQAVLQLDARGRYSYFVKRVADWEATWGLWGEGWALVGDDSGRQGLPLWPTREFAEACATREWAGYQPQEISLDDLLGELLPKLSADDVGVAVFPTPQDQGMIVSLAVLDQNLRDESERYE